MKAKKSDIRELQRITEMVTSKYKDRLIRERYVAPNLHRDIQKWVKDPRLSEEKRRKLQNIKDSGIFDKKEQVVNKTVTKLIDQEIEREINKSIAAGRLSKRPKHGKKDNS
jgi:hypothetical protein